MTSLPPFIQAEIAGASQQSLSHNLSGKDDTDKSIKSLYSVAARNMRQNSFELATVASPESQLPCQESAANTKSVPARTREHRQIERIQFLALCWCLLLAGWNDGSSGPLIPRMQSFYHVNFTIVSLLFVANCIGFIGGAAANVALTDRIGFGKTLVLGSILQIAGYAIQSPAPPFPVLCLGYIFNGFGIAMQDAQANGYVAALQEGAATKMGLLHAAYGLGALSSPLVATQFAQLPHWSYHFLCSLGIALTNVAILSWVFKGKRQEELLLDIGQLPHEMDAIQSSKYRQIWGTKNVHLLAFFILIYVGVEVTTGGWIVTYIIRERGGGPSSGYISSGFFGGLTAGRVLLLWVNKKVGEYRVLYLYSILVLGLELTIWLVPSLIGNAVAVSIIGMLLGPMYPIAINHCARILPRWLLTGAIGWIAGFGQAGSALLPFATGALASKFGISSLQPFMVANICLMVAFWTLVPSKLRRSD